MPNSKAVVSPCPHSRSGYHAWNVRTHTCSCGQTYEEHQKLVQARSLPSVLRSRIAELEAEVTANRSMFMLVLPYLHHKKDSICTLVGDCKCGLEGTIRKRVTELANAGGAFAKGEER